MTGQRTGHQWRCESEPAGGTKCGDACAGRTSRGGMDTWSDGRMGTSRYTRPRLCSDPSTLRGTAHMLTDHMETDAMGWPDFARLLMHPRPSTLTLADFVSQLLTSMFEFARRQISQ